MIPAAPDLDLLATDIETDLRATVRGLLADQCEPAAVNAIYFWRARTEEEHLWAEDPKYRAYHAWMSEHGLFTAPLVRNASAVSCTRRSAARRARSA